MLDKNYFLDIILININKYFYLKIYLPKIYFKDLYFL
jgi:hypothetical protein